ncbi:hypothetical protein MUN82_10010 [Hymenobacter aerilatus]|uniref:AAA family ATPase n=1 Tax=Hymenobacter aerilatus TaxID=2932251 RepID=A0A8T9T366_9BACT|nr:hypothetical protein [Hymenobacter aerilatus]UOR07413.1 hypothetical protein MUN82_10010 [Hymenobacter aerilatus]
MSNKRKSATTPELLHTIGQAVQHEQEMETHVHRESAPKREKQRPPHSHLATILAGEKRIGELAKQPIIGVLPFIRQYEEPIFFSRSINLLQGQTGAHKSRVGELISAVVIAQDAPICDNLGFVRSRELPQEYTLVYVDTERNLASESPAAVQRIKEWAGYNRVDTVPHFRFISLQGIARAERFDALTEFLEYARGTIQTHIVVVIDVLSDCVNDFNDPKDSLLLSDLLNQAINTFDVTFIGIIHENPGTTKARGHLGTEISNKSSTVVQVGYIKQASGEATEVIELRYIKRRHGKRNLVTHARFDEATKQLVKATPQAVKEARSQRQRVATQDMIQPALLKALANGPLEQGKLVAQLCDELKASGRTMRERLKELDGSTLSNEGGQSIRLRSTKDGRSTRYQLTSAPNTTTPE